MLDLIAMTARRVGVWLSIARGFVCWTLYTVLPVHRWEWAHKLGFAVLPYAGDYAFADDPYVKESREHWIKTGRHHNQEAFDGPF